MLEMNYKKFLEIFEEEVIRHSKSRENLYTYSPDKSKVIVSKMREHLISGHYDKDTPSFKSTCERLGIKNTYKDIYNFMEGN